MKKSFVLVMVFVHLLVAKGLLAQTKGVIREVWTGVTLTSPNDLVVSPNMFGLPTTTSALPAANFSAPVNQIGPFVARYTTKLTVPVTGNYVFWIAANKIATLWLSPTQSMMGQNYLCRVSASFPTPAAQQWTRNPEQKSVSVYLVRGNSYYLQVVHVAQAGSVNHMAVGWQLTSGVYERPIPKSRLIRVVPDYLAPTVAITSLTPNQNVQGTVGVTLSVSDNVGVVGVQFKIDNVNVGAEILASPFSIDLDTTTLSEGTHTITAVARDAVENTGTTSTNFTVVNLISTVVNPGLVEFSPSLDHDVMLDEIPAVTRYELGFYAFGASSPVSSFDLGKPTPEMDGKIRYDFSTSPVLLGTPLGNYRARVAAVGPNGTGLSDESNVFVIIR